MQKPASQRRSEASKSGLAERSTNEEGPFERMTDSQQPSFQTSFLNRFPDWLSWRSFDRLLSIIQAGADAPAFVNNTVRTVGIVLALAGSGSAIVWASGTGTSEECDIKIIKPGHRDNVGPTFPLEGKVWPASEVALFIRHADKVGPWKALRKLKTSDIGKFATNITVDEAGNYELLSIGMEKRDLRIPAGKEPWEIPDEQGACKDMVIVNTNSQ